MSGPRSDTETIDARRKRLIELMSEGMSQARAAEVLKSEGFPADGDTIWRDIRTLGLRATTNMSDFDKYRANQLIELSELKVQLVDPRIKPDKKVELALAIIDREMRLLGTAAPTKSIQAHVSAGDSAPYMDFKAATAGLDNTQLEEVLAFAKSMPRIEPEKTALWFPKPPMKEIEDGPEEG